MDIKQFSLIRMLILLAVGAIVLTALITNNLYLAISSVLIGVLFISMVRHKYHKVIIDERVVNVSGNAARWTYLYSTLLLSVIGLFFIFSSHQHGDSFLESLGAVFSYIAIFNIALYAIFFHYFNKKYGGD